MSLWFGQDLQWNKIIPWTFWLYLILPPSGWKSRQIFFPGHGLYYERFTKEGVPNHSESFLRGILDYDEDCSEQILSFSTESSPEPGSDVVTHEREEREGTSRQQRKSERGASG
jgi:hypothetical protein